MQNSVESRYVDLCDEIIRQGCKIAAQCATGHPEQAGVLAASLVDYANNAKQVFLMLHEVSMPEQDRYDLKSLRDVKGGGESNA